MYNETNINLIIEIIKKYKPQKVEIFKLHNLAEKKYKSLGINFKKNEQISNEKLEKLKMKISKNNVDVQIISI